MKLYYFNFEIQPIENGIGLQDFFKSVEQKTSEGNSKHESVFNKIALELAKEDCPIS